MTLSDDFDVKKDKQPIWRVMKAHVKKDKTPILRVMKAQKAKSVKAPLLEIENLMRVYGVCISLCFFQQCLRYLLAGSFFEVDILRYPKAGQVRPGDKARVTKFVPLCKPHADPLNMVLVSGLSV